MGASLSTRAAHRAVGNGARFRAGLRPRLPHVGVYSSKSGFDAIRVWICSCRVTGRMQTQVP